jgi:hypothetical protein
MSKRIVISIALLTVVSHPAYSQDSRVNTNIGGGVSVPLNPTGKYAGAGGTFAVGAGYNFDKYNSLVGEFMWSALPPTISTLLPGEGLHRSSNLYTATGNYMLRLDGHRFGAYLIGGGGLYYRHFNLQRQILQPGIVCTNSWIWWGYTCAAGYVSTDQTLISSGSSAFGGNAGAGFTIKIADSGEKVYVESRYHYAPNKNISTQLVLVTFGFRF